MVLGDSGFDRLLPGIVPGAVPQLPSSPASGQSIANHTRTAVAAKSALKLLLPQFTMQIGWLYPLAVR